MTVPISAKNGTASWEATALFDVTDISFADTNDVQVYASSSTSGARSRVEGHDDEEGSFTMLADVVPFAKGEVGTLLLKSTASITLFTGEAIISDITYSVPIGAGSIVEASVTWGAVPTATP